METCPAKDFIVTDPPYGVRVPDPVFQRKSLTTESAEHQTEGETKRVCSWHREKCPESHRLRVSERPAQRSRAVTARKSL